MLLISEIKLALNEDENKLKDIIIKRLKLKDNELLNFEI